MVPIATGDLLLLDDKGAQIVLHGHGAASGLGPCRARIGLDPEGSLNPLA